MRLVPDVVPIQLVFSIAHRWVSHVVVQQEGVHLTVHILHRDLEAVEGTGLWCLDVCSVIVPQGGDVSICVYLRARV
jgi:hypothetical protein